MQILRLLRVQKQHHFDLKLFLEDALLKKYVEEKGKLFEDKTQENGPSENSKSGTLKKNSELEN